jgi:DNA-3-methyladenine glycosylase II
MPDMQYFEYGEKEIEYLKSRDPLLGAVIDEIGHIDRAVIHDMFTALINAIVGQQISAKAQATIWTRMQERFAAITPETIQTTAAEELQTCGCYIMIEKLHPSSLPNTSVAIHLMPQ